MTPHTRPRPHPLAPTTTVFVAVAFAVALTQLAAAAPPTLNTLNLASTDGSLRLAVDATTGAVVAATVNGAPRPWTADMQTQLGDGARATQPPHVAAGCGGSCVEIERAFAVGGVAVTVRERLSAQPTSVAWQVNVSSATTSTAAQLATAPIITNVQFPGDTSGLKLWCPWDRGSAGKARPTIDPLLPSDGHGSWWDGHYRYGTLTGGAPDMVVAPHATVLDEAGHAGLSVVLSPDDPFLELDLVTNGPTLQGPLGGRTRSSTAAAAGPAGFQFQRSNFRMGGSTGEHVFNLDLVGHAASWRSGLNFSVGKYPEHWNPTTPSAQALASGLGSYSWSLGDLTDPIYNTFDYRVNWDLSGRFFPYMGMFLPPVSPGTVWLNDPEGSQARANVSFPLIDSYYARIQREGFTTLSYYNVFEYGLNMVCPPAAESAPHTSANASDWKDANVYLRDHMVDAPFQHTWAPGEKQAFTGCRYTWQRGIVMDPATPSYHHHLEVQMQLHVDQLPHFQGVVVDRSDWNRIYNLDADDGISLVLGNRTARSMKGAYQAVIADMHDILQSRNVSNIMLINTLGYCALSLFRHFDGSFSEGHAIASAGLLGLRSPAIMWTYDATECCPNNSSADIHSYFQWRLYLGVFPMAPFPGADHSIPRGGVQDAAYAMYGHLFRALQGRTWILDEPFPVRVVGGAAVMANAFDVAGGAKVYPLVNAAPETNTTAVSTTVELNGLPQGAKTFEVAFPGAGGGWTPVDVPGGTASSVNVTVPLQNGMALLRVK